ncbi:MAG: hypothetical protein F4183_00185 [Rhodothermaceae bacterium]|nr:hypothetical protein [Rhodothermaceae bacterium]MYF62898.1 hypothetical protein [Rhodothermaceae bacterium]
MKNKQEEFLDIYRLHAELTDRVRQRRQRVSQLFVTLFAVLSAAFIASTTTDSSAELKSVRLYIGIAGILLSMSWWYLIGSYQSLEKVKFDLLYQLEKHLAFPFFDHERESLRKSKNLYLYFKLDNAEKIPPGLFFILSVGSILCRGLSEAGISCDLLQ